MMKVFLSWSGERSRIVAEILRGWIQCVLQATKPWISSKNIDRGAIWFGEINDQLKDTKVGIICLTQENKDRPWILFEAGALLKGLESNRICTFLIDLQPKDISGPLSHFNHTSPNKEGMWSLVETLNSNLGKGALDTQILLQAFDALWPKFETDFKTFLETEKSSQPAIPRSDSDILAEILENTRYLTARISNLERMSTDAVTQRTQQSYFYAMRSLVSMLVDNGLSDEDIITHVHARDPAVDPVLRTTKRGFLDSRRPAARQPLHRAGAAAEWP